MAQMASSICQANEAGQHVTVVPGQLETLPSLPAEQASLDRHLGGFVMPVSCVQASQCVLQYSQGIGEQAED